MAKDLIKKKKLKRTKGRNGLFTVNIQAVDGMEAGEIKQMMANMNAQTDPLYLAERYEQAAISYIESFGYEYKTSGQKTIPVPREERERLLKAYNELLREKFDLKDEEEPLSIDDIETERVVCWWVYLLEESKKQGKHGIRYALDVISITTQIKNSLKKSDYNRLFNLAMKLTNCFSIMVIAQYEDKICAGASRTEPGSKAKSEIAAEKRQRAIELAEECRAKKTSNKHNELTKERVYNYVATNMSVSRSTAKRLLVNYFLDFPLK